MSNRETKKSHHPKDFKSAETSLKKGALLTLSIEDIAFGGKGIARLDDFIIFVPRTIPGQIVNTRIIKKKNNYAEAIAIELIQDSADATPAPCPHFGICGGCLFQNLKYERQLAYKRNQVLETVLKWLGSK